MAAVLGHKLGGFQAVRGEFHAVAVLFEHAAYKFPDADGIVGNYDHAFVFVTIDGVGRNRATGDGLGSRCKDASSAGAGLQRAALVGLGGDHAIQIDQQYQAAVWGDRGAWEKLYATKVFAEILDDDFVFAEDLFDDQADLAIARVGYNHAEVAVEGFQRRQAEIAVETNDFGDDVANFGKEFAADVFEFVGANAADFLDDRERQDEADAAAADKQRGRNNQRQGHLEGEFCALAARAFDFDVAV